MSGNYFLFVLAVFAAFLTAFYMFRLYFLVFTGEAKTKEDVHDSPRIMTYPMIVLGVLAVVAGYINTPWFGTFLGDWLTKDIQFKVEEAHGPVWIMIVATLVSFGGLPLRISYMERKLSQKIGQEEKGHFFISS